PFRRLSQQPSEASLSAEWLRQRSLWRMVCRCHHPPRRTASAQPALPPWATSATQPAQERITVPLVKLEMNPSRICDGHSKIGYTPPAAMTDIIDNAVSAKAKRVTVKIRREKHLSDTRKDNVREYLIIDDGGGMDQEQLLNALAL